jgi:ATPase subunit of ABC transporter with duplicated ATPase domains
LLQLGQHLDGPFLIAHERALGDLEFQQVGVELRLGQHAGHGFDEGPLFNQGNLILEAGARLAVLGENGVGKTTLLRCLLGQLEADQGSIRWAENATIGYCPQDNTAEFNTELSLFDWMSQWRRPCHNDQIVRATLGQLLFSSEDFEKPVKVCSGGEKNRLLFGKLLMSAPNVLVMDEPTNHLDMEAIEALNLALAHYDGTLIFVSHDREFVSSLATQVIEISDQTLTHFDGTYEEYLVSQNVIPRAVNS